MPPQEEREAQSARNHALEASLAASRGRLSALHLSNRTRAEEARRRRGEVACLAAAATARRDACARLRGLLARRVANVDGGDAAVLAAAASQAAAVSMLVSGPFAALEEAHVSLLAAAAPPQPLVEVFQERAGPPTALIDVLSDFPVRPPLPTGGSARGRADVSARGSTLAPAPGLGGGGLYSSMDSGRPPRGAQGPGDFFRKSEPGWAAEAAAALRAAPGKRPGPAYGVSPARGAGPAAAGSAPPMMRASVATTATAVPAPADWQRLEARALEPGLTPSPGFKAVGLVGPALFVGRPGQPLEGSSRALAQAGAVRAAEAATVGDELVVGPGEGI